MCKAVGLSKHAEKWIQIKFRLANYPFNEFCRYFELKWSRDRENPDPLWRWIPDFLPPKLVQDLKRCFIDIKDSFAEVMQNFSQLPELHPYKRKSFLNFDWVIVRLLYLLCPCCPDNAHGGEQCYATRYAWPFKTISTKSNLKNHTAWWYFLIGHLIKKTQYDKPESKPVDWRICQSDQILLKNEPECPALRYMVYPSSDNPDLEYRHLRSYAGSSHHKSGPGGQVFDDSDDSQMTYLSQKQRSQLRSYWQSDFS